MARPLPSSAPPSVDPHLARTLWQWLVVGALVLVAWPAARGHGALLGWGPYWAVVAPTLGLLVAYRRAIVARFAPAQAPGTTHRRRPPSARGQAQRAGVASRRNARRQVA